MRILLLGNIGFFNHEDFGLGGIETTLQALRKYLTAAGHEVKIVHVGLVPESFEKEVNPDPDVLFLKKLNPIKKIWPTLYIKKELREIIKNNRPDMVWCRNIQLGLAVEKLVDCPIFHIFPELIRIVYLWDFSKDNIQPTTRRRLMGSILEFYKWIRRLPRHLFEKQQERKVIKKFGLVVFSENMREQIQKTYGISPEAVHVIHPGVDENKFNKERGREQFRVIEKKYGLREDQKFILFVGRLVVGKNIPLLLRAMALTQGEKRLVIVGDGPLRDKLETYVREIGMSTRVLFVGRQDELLAGFYAMARVFVNPCLNEPFGHVLIESLFCGTPVIGIRSDGSKTVTAIDEVTDGGKFGRQVDANPEAMAKAIDEMISLKDEDYRTMSEKGIESVRNRYNWPKFIERMMNLPARP